MRRHAKAIVAASALLLLTMALGVNFATATAPTVSIDAPSSVSYTSVHLSGKVNPEDREATYRFEYQVAAEWWMGWTSGSTLGPLAANSGDATVQDDLTGLKPGTEYAVRLVAESFDGEAISAEPNPTFTTDAVPAPTVSIDAPSSVTSSSAHFSGTIDPEAPGANPSAFDVNWAFQCTPECPGLSGTIPADSDPHTVEADATGLQPGTAYKVTLVATNAGGSASAGPESFATGLLAPVIVSQQVGPSATEAALSAQINPGGSATYRFEYGPSAAYGTSTATKTINGNAPVTVKANMLGLTPATGYHFRVVAENSEGTAVGADVPFTTSSSQGSGACPNDQIRLEQNSSGLPDCRAYEMISPPQKNGNDIGGWVNRVKIAPGGDRVNYSSSGAFGGTPGSGTGKTVNYLAGRSGGDWDSKLITPAQSPRPNGAFGSDHPFFTLFSTDLSKAVLMNVGIPLTEDAIPGTANIYLREDTASSPRYELMTPGSTSPTWGAFKVADAADELGAVAFSGEFALLPDAPSGVRNLYVWDHGKLTMPSDLPGPGGQMAPNGSDAGEAVPNLISDDGSRVVFEAPTDSSSPTQIYQRDGDEIHHVSAPQRPVSGPDPIGTLPASFVGASADGSRVFFYSGEKLTEDSTAEGLAEDIYMYETETGELTDLTIAAPGEPSVAVGRSAQRALVGLSDDGSYVYFVATNSPAGALGTDRFPEPAFDNGRLYVWHEGEIRQVGLNGSSSPYGIDLPLDNLKISQVTPNGQSLIFISNKRLTSGNNAGFDAVYLYRFASDEVTCMSCPRDGSPMTAHAELGTFRPGGFEVGYRPPRYMSDDGSKATFATGTSLVPQDSNGKQDVYLYENGAVHLISSGRSNADSFVGDMTPDGSDVLFTTREQLLPQDIDQNLDLYDARVDGGLALTSLAPSPCEGEGCLPPPGGPPAKQAVGSDRAQERSPARKRCKGTPRSTRAKKAAASSRAGERKKQGKAKNRGKRAGKCRSGK